MAACLVLACVGCDRRAIEHHRSTPRTLEARDGAVMLVGRFRPTEPGDEAAAPPHVERETSVVVALSGGGGGDPKTLDAPVCVANWSSDAVSDALEQCIAGNGEGCVGIGDEYRNGCDAPSSIKWYRRGCRLGSEDACTALTGLGEPVPPPDY